MLFEISLHQVLHRRCGAALIPSTKRIDALVNLALDLLGLLAGSDRGPVREVTNEQAPAASLKCVVEREALAAGLANLNAKANDFIIHVNRRLAAIRFCGFYKSIGQPCAHRSCLVTRVSQATGRGNCKML